MSRRNSGYERGDDPIDWSGFDEKNADAGPVEGSTPLRVVCLVMIVAGIAGVIWGVNAFGAEMEELGSTGQMGSLSPIFVAIAGGLTLIPAAFGLQIAGNPVSFVPPTVLGLVGIVVSMVMVVFGLIGGSLGGSTAILPWLIGLVLALLYLVFVVRVHKAENAREAARYRGRHTVQRSSRHRPTKDELWDEKNIWK